MTENKVLSFIKLYKWHLLIWTIGIIVFGSYIYKKVTSPTVLLNGIFLNVENKDAASSLSDDFTKLAGYEDTVYEVTFDTSLTYTPNDDGSHSDENFDAVEAVVSQKEVEKLDFVAGPIDSMLDIAYASMFSELTTTLSEEQLALVEPYLLYVDQTVMEQLEEANDKKKDVSSIALPDPTKPEEMKEPLALMIDMSSCPEIAEIYGNDGDMIAFGLITSAPNDDMLTKFIDFLMKQ